MASIIDSFREVFSDKFSFLKILVFAAPTYYAYTLYVSAKGHYGGFWNVTIIILFFLLGFLVKVIGNVINERDSVLPSLNPFKLAVTSAKCIAAIAIPTIIPVFITNYICSLINIIPWLDYVIKSILWLIVASIILTSLLMFSTKERIQDVFKPKIIFDKAGDLILVIIVYLIQLIVINIPTTAFLGYTILVLFGFCPLFYIFLAYSLIFNISATGHYLAQIHYENFIYDKTK